MKTKAYRLPHNVRPLSYDIELSAAPTRADFSGRVTMQLDVQRAAETTRIEMHARDLGLADAVLRVGGEEVLLSIALDPDSQTVAFFAPRPLPAGRVELQVAFAGQLNPSMHGLYLASDGKDRAVCTQCEATDARAIFPCFDEPEFKASLKWTLRTDRGLTALSNGPLDQLLSEDGTSTYRFHATRPVSSYLAAVAIGDLESSAETTVNGVPIRIYCPRGKVAQTRFAHEYTERLLPWYEEYFGYPYPYGKYDQVAVPGFDAGAMENIGLVLFRQNLLLMEPQAASWRQEKNIARVVAHEFAHMWFGNLVTMRWWDDLWLNEAFAEWMAHKVTHALRPDYLIWSDFQDDKNRALADDALPTTHPIWTPVETPEEAIEMFDAITYQKGCAVMRMLENFLGEAPFRDGLRAYMRAFAEKNATGADLWQKLAEASGRPVGALMQSWIAQPGFPIVDVAVSESGRALRQSQRRFFSSPRDSQAENDQLWSIPLVVRYEDDEGTHEHRFIMDGGTHEEPLPGRGPLRWVCANAGEMGFYRVRLDRPLLAALLRDGLPHLSPVEQMGLIEDQWALVRNATGEIGPFVDVLAGFSETRDHNVLRAVVDRLYTLDLILKDSGDRDARLRLRAWIARLFGDHLAELGYAVRPGEEQNQIQRRALLISAVASLARVPEAIASAEALAEVERAEPRAVDANLAGTFVNVAAKFGDEARFDAFVSTFGERRSRGAPPQEVLRYLYALPAFRRAELVRRTLSLIEDSTVPQESIGVLMGQLLSQRHSQDLAWEAMKSGWPTLRERVGDMGLSRLVEAVGCLRPAQRADVVAFFQRNVPKGAERALARALEAMDQRDELFRRVTPALIDYFRRA
jgi:puromycin-sensitive aminopeptidase